jgi:hypothetical protein
MPGQSRFVLAVALAASALLVRQAAAETLAENSAETRLQLDFAVNDAAVHKVLPPGWDTDVATSGGAKDCNLRMIFIDRIDVNGPDDAAKGTSQLVIIEVPVKKPGAGLAGRMIMDGVTADPKDAPGAFGVYRAAVAHRMERSTVAPAGAPIQTVEHWEFTAANGEHMELHLKYERGVARKGGGEVKFFSGANPGFYQIGRIAQGLDPMRNATVPTRDRVSEFAYQATGGYLGSLFDGTERVVSIDAIHWHNRAVYLP